MENTKWSCICKTVVGDTHLRKGTPNQDAEQWATLSGEVAVSVLAISDGHGSERCTRSHIGSKIATEVAVDLLGKFCQSIHTRGIELKDPKDSASPAVLQNSIKLGIRRELVPAIIQAWSRRVLEDLQKNPIEFELSPEEKFLPYGATLIAVALSKNFGVFLQLGDGDILVVEEDNTVVHLFQEEGAKIGDETNSLCQKDPAKLFQTEYQVYSPKLNSIQGSDPECVEVQASTPKNVPQKKFAPKTILVSTDGYSNAFSSDESFRKSASDFSQMLSTEQGQAEVQRSLETWLREYSSFSGDDVTLGLLYRHDSENAVEQQNLPANNQPVI
jgi:serine/threonine protein phosphatase PrpC